MCDAFSSSNFFDKLSLTINLIFKQHDLEKMHRELLNRNRKQNNANKAEVSHKFEESYQKLLVLTSNNFDKNMKKYQIYVARNIFTFPTQINGDQNHPRLPLQSCLVNHRSTQYN